MATQHDPVTSQRLAGSLMPGTSIAPANWGWYLARGLLLIVLGLLAAFMPAAALFVFALMFAAFSFADGVLNIIAGVRGATHHRQRWWTLILSGLVGVLVGVLFVGFPILSSIAYATLAVLLIAFWAIATGVAEISAAIRLRREITGEWLLGLSGAVSVLLGVALLWIAMANPAVSVVSVGWIIALYALVAGVALVLLALRLRRLR
ncbi:HdeD family acid-resistance protein [Croceibacterium ferulae]|uniref:HdeD family acid-resistance protein n=1 Tax=Croceibacterium ferulae TaxID=1854641 RepID=UPI000EB58A6E|nr:DUF308 domain-containing protein [Croceibacterium ferulae]